MSRFRKVLIGLVFVALVAMVLRIRGRGAGPPTTTDWETLTSTPRVER